MTDERQTSGDDSWRCRVRVDAGDGWFDGHFPGRPVMPAVALLHLVHRVWRERAGDAPAIAGFEQWRFLATVRPGETIELEIGGAEAGAARVAIRRGGERIASGVLRFEGAS